MIDAYLKGMKLADDKDVQSAIKTLNEITYFPKVIGMLNANDDLDKITQRGIYQLMSPAPQNAPAGADWSFLFNLPFDANTIFQFILGGDTILAFRKVWPIAGTKTDWNAVATSNDIQNLQNQIDELKKK